MQDLYNRKITYMRLSVTDRCNYRCPYCMPPDADSHKDPLSFDKLYNVCKAGVACGIKKIRITGGEPLTRDGIVDFCAKISKLDGLEDLAITTNGYFLQEYAQQLFKANVNRLNISIDTLDKEKYTQITKHGDLDKVLLGIKSAIECGFKNIKINVVLIKGFNDNEISDFVELTKDNDICIRFIELMPTHNSAFDYSSFMPCSDVLKIVPNLKKVSFDNVTEIYKIDGYKGSVGLIRPISSSFCDKCNRIRITSDGKLKPCLHSDDEYALTTSDVDILTQEISNAIKAKPKSHSLSTCFSSDSKRSMYQIGG